MDKRCATCYYRINTNEAEEQGLISKHERDLSFQTMRTDYCNYFNSIVDRRNDCTHWIHY
jgi:hypothetical protein